jgi:hypothetical protein
MLSQAEIGLVKIDENMADADCTIRDLGSLVPRLAAKDYPTAEIRDSHNAVAGASTTPSSTARHRRDAGRK